MRICVVAASIFLAGCATTPNSIRRDAPKATYPTSRTMPELERCLAENLSHLGGPAIIRDADRESMMFGTGGITSLIIDIEPGQVTIRSGYPYFANLKHRVEGCLS